MTEAEWLASDDVSALLNFVAPHTSRRKERLFAVACCRRHPELLADECHKTLLALERIADEPWPIDAMETLESEALADADGLSWQANTPSGCACWFAADALYDAVSFRVAAAAQDMRRATATAAIPPDQFDVTRPEPAAPLDPVENTVQLRLLRDVFGNPFRRRPFSPAWRTDTAVALAQQMYESRDFSPAPVLADALQDAGCDHDDLLNHLRDPEGTHVRGCWAVDLVLEKL
jgi:hypothetical protein